MYCPKCGCEYRDGFYRCADCNVDLVEGKPIIVNNGIRGNHIYANLSKRLGALLIDMLIIIVLIAPFLYGFIVWMLNRELLSPIMITIVSSLIELIPFWLYFSLFESSKFKASIGKMIFKIIVVDYKGERLSFKKAAIRSLFKIISLMLGLIELVIIVTSKKKQATHDNIVNTLVLESGYENELQK